MEVDLTTYSDCDFSLTQAVAVAPGINPLHLQVRSSALDPTVWIELTTANFLITVSGSNVTIYIPQSKLMNLPPGAYVQSLIMSSQNGTKRTEVWRGSLTHNAGPTQWAAGTP